MKNKANSKIIYFVLLEAQQLIGLGTENLEKDPYVVKEDGLSFLNLKFLIHLSR